jgi:hypothetical protein
MQRIIFCEILGYHGYEGEDYSILDVAQCNVLGIYRRFRSIYYLLRHGNEAVSASENSANIYHLTWCYIPKDSLFIVFKS